MCHHLKLYSLQYILLPLLFPLTPDGVVEAPACFAVSHFPSPPSVAVVCEEFLGVLIMWRILGHLTWRNPSLSRLYHSRCYPARWVALVVVLLRNLSPLRRSSPSGNVLTPPTHVSLARRLKRFTRAWQLGAITRET